ncbi:glycosyltransferase [Varunaivibrio sulfuroxidans]|uniref:glycosyltransferase n=1 Tax=Varunaivibrio sulfuroxidans TaxID=1773489 RepID=UPI001043F6C5|nr:glycosyltransferase [Varunaivibrio sulfuroxidans]WES31951.1 glycosyltransferase [Varunaivibrio sulfuroxidans]
MENKKIAVVLPCFNEAAVIANVVCDFKTVLPGATVYVIDNNSTDETADVARRAGAIVLHEALKGKGNAVRRAFCEIEADVYIMADGDGTYDHTRAAQLVRTMFDNHLDMVVATRHTESKDAYRRGHQWGNILFNAVLRFLFGEKFTDIFSGYRVFSRRFVKTFPALSCGFEIETELSVHAIQMGIPCREVPTVYFDRAAGTVSKLKTYRDGWRILLTMVKLMKHVRPMAMFAAIGGVLAGLSLLIGAPVIVYFLQTHTVPRIPSTVAAASLMILSAISFVTGIILDSITYASTVNKRLMYLSHRSPYELKQEAPVKGDGA